MKSSSSRNYSRIGWLAALLPLYFSTLAAGQVAFYGIEEIEAREAEDAATVEASAEKPRYAPVSMPTAASSIGSARSGVRGRGGQSTMLRYDQHREITPPAYATLRVGPLYSDIGIAQSIGYRYTRFSGTETDFLEGTRRGEIKTDGNEFPMVSSLTLKNYLIITRKLDLEVNLGISYHYFPLDTQEDELRVSLTDEGVFATFSTQLMPSPFSRILIYDDILYRTDYIDTRGISDRLGGERYRVFSNTLGLDWDFQPSPLDTFSAAANRRDNIPLDDEFDRQRGVLYSEMGSYRRSLNPFTTVGVLGTASQSFYDDNSRPDVNINGISAFIGMRMTPSLSGDGSLGYSVTTSTGGDLDESRDQGSVTASAGLNHEISESKDQRLAFHRSLSEDFQGGVNIADTAAYNLSWSEGWFPGSFSSTYSLFDPQVETRNSYSDWTTSLGVQHRLSRMITLSLGASYTMRMNETLASTSDAVDEPQDASDYETLSLNVSTGFQVTRKTELVAYASHMARTSDNQDLEFTRQIVGLTLSWSHQF